MKPFKLTIFGFTYTIDLAVIVLFAAVSIDIISTFLFVNLNAGVEQNHILATLIDISIWFIPVYLLATDAIFIPFLSSIIRRAFSYAFALISIVLAVNNFSLVILDSAFLIDTIGFNGIVIFLVLSGFGIFAYFLTKEKLDRKEIQHQILKFFLFILFIIMVHLVFLGIALLASIV